MNAKDVKAKNLITFKNLDHDTGSFSIDNHEVGMVGVGGITTFEFTP
jgi:hypothetical protein